MEITDGLGKHFKNIIRSEMLQYRAIINAKNKRSLDKTR